VTAWPRLADPMTGRALTEASVPKSAAVVGLSGRDFNGHQCPNPGLSPANCGYFSAQIIGGGRCSISHGNGEKPPSEGSSRSVLLRLLPGILEALLAYWFEPGEPSRLARAALAAHG
jgi:hypothetical protein